MARRPSPVLPRLCVALCYAAAAAATTRGYCRDPDSGASVLVADCANSCCVDGECGTEEACRAAWMVGVVIASCVVFCCCCLGLVACAVCTCVWNKGPLAKKPAMIVGKQPSKMLRTAVVVGGIGAAGELAEEALEAAVCHQLSNHVGISCDPFDLF